MIHEKIAVQAVGSLPESYIKTYIIEDSHEFRIKKRPVVIVCPGGGYCYLSDREGEILALQYNAMGFHAVVLHYSVAPAICPAAFLEMAQTVALLREKAGEWHIDTDKIIVEGASAGGHLAAGYGMFWSENWMAEQLGEVQPANEDLCRAVQNAAKNPELLRPNGMILNYPVITSGEFAHRDSFRNLLGERYDELVDKMSLENQVNKNTPPAFIWHTFEDNCVPVENSLMLAAAMRKEQIPVEFHMYPRGGHGLSLATPLTQSPEGDEVVHCCQSWIDLVKTWIQEL